MISTLAAILLVLFMVGALFTIPFGLPGTWIMILVLLGMTVVGEVAWVTWGILAGLALLAELIEWAVVAWMGKRYGGSSRAFWGALVGGIVGVLVGMPVPLFGPILAGVVGTFLGAAAVTLYETRSLETASRVGWGTALARIIAVGVKVGVGVVVLTVGGGALFVG
ncbi:MAG: DUF456 family protein [Longimicrobiales bacterium]